MKTTQNSMFILASASPRREELLKLLIDDFAIIPADIDESLIEDFVSPMQLSYEEAKLKSYNIYSKYKDNEVLGCDTVVVLNGKALGKPKNYDDAFDMLKRQSGKEEMVISSYTYLSPSKEISRCVISYVIFNELTDEQIHEYLKNYQPFDKAGSYGIQDDYPLIKSIKGSYYNIMGLPIEDLKIHVFNKR